MKGNKSFGFEVEEVEEISEGISQASVLVRNFTTKKIRMGAIAVFALESVCFSICTCLDPFSLVTLTLGAFAVMALTVWLTLALITKLNRANLSLIIFQNMMANRAHEKIMELVGENLRLRAQLEEKNK